MTNDLTTRAIPLVLSTLDETNRSIEAVMTTEERVQVFDMRTWSVIEEVLRVDGMQIPDKLVLLDSHDRSSVRNILGSVKEIRKEGGLVSGRLFFSDDSDTEPTWQKARQGHLDSVSVGYEVTKHSTIKPGETRTVAGQEYTAGAMPLRVSTESVLRELSVVPIGADPNAKTRSERGAETLATTETREMPKKIETEEQLLADEGEILAPVVRTIAPTAPPVDAEAERQAGAKAERQRIVDLRTMASDDVPADVLQRAIDDGLTKEQAGPVFLESVRATRAEPVATRVEMGEHRPENFHRALESALCAGCGVVENDEKVRAEADKYRGIGLQDLARLVLRSEGQEVPLNSVDLAARALSTGTFSGLLTSTADKSLKAVYAEHPGTFVRWAARRSVKDFHEKTDVSLSSFNTIEKIGKNGEISHGALADSTETFRAYTYGIQFAVGRTEMINDDLNGFQRAVRSLALACARNIDDLAYALLTSASGVGPTMSEDSKALFSTTHAQANYSASAVAINDAGLLTAKKLMGKIKGLPDAEGNSAHLNLFPKFLLCPTDLEDAALRATTSRDMKPVSTSGGYTNNIHYGTFDVIREPRLDGATNGTTAWYLIADTSQAELMALVSLNGNTTPYLEKVSLPNVLGQGWRVYHDVGVAAVDWRGGYRSKGA